MTGLILFSAGSSIMAVDWIVLPEKTNPYSAPSLKATTLSLTLRYPQTVEAKASISGGGSEKEKEPVQWVAFDREDRRQYLPMALLVKKILRPGGKKGNLNVGREVVDRHTPLPLDYKPTDLVKLDQKWNYHSPDLSKRLRAEAALAAARMLQDAEKNHRVRLRVSSAYRSAASQRYLYLRKIAQSGLDQKLVAKPGHSEHQLGTTLDICGLDPKTALKPSFAQTPEGRWLVENAWKYGFRHSYTEANAKETGYSPEPWHIRYVGKAAAKRP